MYPELFTACDQDLQALLKQVTCPRETTLGALDAADGLQEKCDVTREADLAKKRKALFEQRQCRNGVTIVIERERRKLLWGCDGVFDAYVAKEKRRFGYFTLPVLVGEAMVAALDLKADRATGKLLIQSWHWLDAGRPRTHKKLIESELDRFAKFQFGDSPQKTQPLPRGRR